MTSYRLRSYLLLLAVAAIWGAAAPVIKFTLSGLDPLPFLAYRFLVAAAVSIGIFAYKISKGKKFRDFRKHFPLVLLYGILAVPLALGILFFGLDKSTVTDLTLVGVIGPLMVTLGGVIFFKDRITNREKLGIGVVLTGVFLNSIFPLFKHDSVRLTGNILLLLFLVCDSSSVLIAKKVVKDKVKSANVTNFAFIIGALVFVPLAVYQLGFVEFTTTLTSLPFKYHLGVWYMALFSGSLAYYLYVRGQKSIEVSEATLFNYLQPVFMIPLAIFWLKETLSPSFVLGAAIIAAGLFIAEHKKRN